MLIEIVRTSALPANNGLQRTVMDKVPTHEGQRAAVEPGRYTSG